MASKPNTTPIYPGTVLTAVQRAGTLNANRDGTGTIVDLVSLAATDQAAVVGRVDAMHAGAIGAASTAMLVRLYRKNGGVYRLIDEVALASVTPTASVPGAKNTFSRTNILLQPGEALGVSVSVAENVDVAAEYTPY